MKILITFILMLLGLTSHAATYYVNSSTGNDSAAGSSGTPWLTLKLSIPKLSAGDTLSATGSFSDDAGYGTPNTFSVSGTAANPITLRGNGATITIVCGGDTYAQYTFSGNYITIDGFTFVGSASGPCGAIDFEGSTNAARNLTMSNMQGALLGGGDTLMLFENRGNYNTFSNILFNGCNDFDCFRVWGTNNLITHCTITNCGNPHYDSNGIHADLVQCWDTGLKSISNVVEYCRFLNSSISGGMLQDRNSGNISPNGTSLHTFIYRNNIFSCTNATQWIQVYMPGCEFYNNIFYNYGSYYNESFYVDSECVNAMLQNNVFIGAVSGVQNFGAGKVVDYNAYDSSSWTSANTYQVQNGAHTISTVTATACFVNAPYDFHLVTTSPLRAAGANLSAHYTGSAVDFDGNTRPASGAWDIGPYQYSSGSTNAVQPPANLTVKGNFIFGILKTQ